MENFQEITKFLLTLAKKADEIMIKYYSPGGIASERKEDTSPVTIADKEINSILISEAKKSYPDYEILAEEESTNISQSKKLFVVDPLDGTEMFARGIPLFAFMAAVVIDGECTAGVISNPIAKRTVVAEKGKGAYLVEENKRIFVSDKKSFEKALVNSGWNATELPTLLQGKGARTPQLYSIGEIASLIATGNLEGTVFRGLSSYDVAAGKIIIEEAGGKVTDLSGKDQRYDRDINGAVLSNGHLHDELVAMAKAAGIKATSRNK